MSFASTVVVTRLLADVNELQTQNGNLAIGWLIVQDVLAVLALVLLPSLADSSNTSWINLIGVIEIAALKIAVAAIAIVFLGGKIIPRILHGIASTRSRELFTLTVLVLVLGIAMLSARVFGVSMALGAFLAGVVIGQSDFSVRATTEALPMRDAFAVLFFVSVGMLFNPQVFFLTPGLFAWTLLIAMVLTPLLSILLMLGLGLPLKSALRVGFAFAQIGEFSFIVANLARSQNMIDEALVHVLVAVSIFSIALSPWLQKLVEPLVRFAGSSSRLRGLLVMRHPWTLRPAVHIDGIDSDEIIEEFRTVVVGYGPVGRTAARLLKENGISPTIIEMNPRSIESIRKDGHRVVLGDASHIETLKHAGVETALSLILSASSIEHASNVIRMAKLLNTHIKIIVRSAYLNERTNLLKFGADQVFAGEAEVALAMTEYILRELGATAEQIDRERDRLRTDFLESHR
jgi:CPA2 family monovalent cation:H+ antiporter-2